ncbi:unnamed protein product [Adineta steineri]|uniref:Uncharacterized protein n=1 Tax=Adineta steineri TaxID=433720 RepID=A0A814T8P2_9BILA|nr:unnamed protein product [Adineta steineri]
MDTPASISPPLPFDISTLSTNDNDKPKLHSISDDNNDTSTITHLSTSIDQNSQELVNHFFRKEFQLALKKMVRRRRQRRNEIGAFCNQTKNVNTIHKPEMTARSNNNANHIQPLE